MNETLSFLIERLPDYLGGHILLSMAALGVGLAISIPLGIVASRRPKLAEYVLGIAGIVQTIPTLALLALMVLILQGTIGFIPAFIALTLYSILPILASTITGIRGIDPNLTEAARALGMDEWQMLRRVQLPLAAPVILSGVRTATVLVVGTATLALPVGGLSLGNYIFAGLSMSNHWATIFGCVFTALLAIYMDQLVHLVELALNRRSKRLAWVAAAGLGIALAFGVYQPIARAAAPSHRPVVTVVSAPWAEQFILSEVMEKMLRQAGFRVDQRQAMSETIQFMALKSDKPVVGVNYLGNIWVTLMHKTQDDDKSNMYQDVKNHMAKEYGIECHRVGFQNNYVFAVDPTKSEILSLDDKERRLQNGSLTIAGDEQFFNRPEWRWVKDKYRTKFRRIMEMDPGQMYGALNNGKVDVICAYSSDARIEKNELQKLADPEKALPEYDAVLLLSREAARDPGIQDALKGLIGGIDLDRMRQANAAVDIDGDLPRQAADVLIENLPRPR